MLARGVAWLKRYQERQIQLLRNAPDRTKPYKLYAANLDAMVYMVLIVPKILGSLLSQTGKRWIICHSSQSVSKSS